MKLLRIAAPWTTPWTLTFQGRTLTVPPGAWQSEITGWPVSFANALDYFLREGTWDLDRTSYYPAGSESEVFLRPLPDGVTINAAGNPMIELIDAGALPARAVSTINVWHVYQNDPSPPPEGSVIVLYVAMSTIGSIVSQPVVHTRDMPLRFMVLENTATYADVVEGFKLLLASFPWAANPTKFSPPASAGAGADPLLIFSSRTADGFNGESYYSTGTVIKSLTKNTVHGGGSDFTSGVELAEDVRVELTPTLTYPWQMRRIETNLTAESATPVVEETSSSRDMLVGLTVGALVGAVALRG